MKMSNNKTDIKIVSSFFAGVLLTALIFFIINLISNKNFSTTIKKIDDSIVSIEVYENSNLVSTGTGFAYKKDSKYAYIITNEHVVSEGTIKVINSNNIEQKAKLLGTDTFLDVAVLKVDSSLIKELVTLGNSNNSNIGDKVYTIGSPAGVRYSGSVTSGIISGKERIVPVGNSSEWIVNAIQFDAHINPGNSGGPLLDENGNVIGLCTMKLIQEGIEGMSFATPIEVIKPILKDLENNKEIIRPELGIKMTNITNQYELIRNGITIPDNIENGIVVLDILDNSSADKNLEIGDVILKINNDEVKDISFVKYYLYQYKVGDKINLTIIRNNKEKKITIKLK